MTFKERTVKLLIVRLKQKSLFVCVITQKIKINMAAQYIQEGLKSSNNNHHLCITTNLLLWP